MGYRTRIVRRYFNNVASPSDWFACAVISIGSLCLKHGKTYSPWANRLLPKSVSLRFKRFGDVKVALNPASYTHHLVLREFIFDNSYDLNRVPFTPAHVIDCGAHIGLFLRLCRARFPNVPMTAFEPQIGNAPFARSAGPAELLTMHEAAVGSEDGTVIFDDDALAGFGSVSKNEGTKSAGAHAVPLVSLPKLLSSLGNRPLLLKIDIEGAERELLPHIVPLLPDDCAFFLETHHGEEGWAAAATRLEAQGFKGEQLRVWGPCIDGFFLRQKSAKRPA